MRAEAMVTGRVSMDGSRVVAAMAVKMAVEARKGRRWRQWAAAVARAAVARAAVARAAMARVVGKASPMRPLSASNLGMAATEAGPLPKSSQS